MFQIPACIQGRGVHAHSATGPMSASRKPQRIQPPPPPQTFVPPPLHNPDGNREQLEETNGILTGTRAVPEGRSSMQTTTKTVDLLCQSATVVSLSPAPIVQQTDAPAERGQTWPHNMFSYTPPPLAQAQPRSVKTAVTQGHCASDKAVLAGGHEGAVRWVQSNTGHASQLDMPRTSSKDSGSR